MATIGRSSTPTAKQLAAAEQVARFAAEQRRLKAAAAERRAAAAATADQPSVKGFVAKPESPRVARPSKYLQ